MSDVMKMPEVETEKTEFQKIQEEKISEMVEKFTKLQNDYKQYGIVVVGGIQVNPADKFLSTAFGCIRFVKLSEEELKELNSINTTEA